MAFNSRTVTAVLALAVMLSASLLSSYGLISFSTGALSLATVTDPYIKEIFRFTVFQALLSTGISVLAGLPLALALYFLKPGLLRSWLLRASLLAFVLPTLIIITGLTALLGPGSWLASLIRPLAPGWQLYGLSGILMAHVYLNLPFAVRTFVLRLEQIPSDSWKITSQFRLSALNTFRYLLWPQLRGSLLSLSGFIFILCFNSFSIVLALGGGPGATTLEVAIYQALKYDFNMDEALILAWLQLITAGSVLWLMNRFGTVSWLNFSSGHSRLRYNPGQQRLCCLLSLLYTLLLALPLLTLLPHLSGFSNSAQAWEQILRATLHSILLAAASAVLATATGWASALPGRIMRARNRPRSATATDWLAQHTLPFPAMVLSVGIFILSISRGWAETLNCWIIIWLNAVVVTPFALSQLSPSATTFDREYNRLISNWRLTPLQQTMTEFRYLKTAFIQTFCLAWIMCMGDVSVFAMFGSDDIITLPWLIYQFAGSYRIDDAAATSVILLLLSITALWIWEKTDAHSQ